MNTRVTEEAVNPDNPANIPESMNIFQRMAAITAGLQTVGKNLTVGYGNSQYKAVSERDVLDAVKPLEAKFGVYSYPYSREIILTDTLTSVTRDRNGNEKESARFLIRMAVKYRFINVDKPDEFVEIDTLGDGIDSGDKAPGKAMTYADKYALLKAYKISTGDDPDQEASPENGYKKADSKRGENPNRTNIPPAGEIRPPDTDSPVVCESCGARLPDWSDGQCLWKAAELGEQSKREFGHTLCAACQQKTRKAAQAT